MKTEKIVWGLLFVFIGSMFLLDNYNVIDFYWRSVWRLWPLIFVVIGANMLFNRQGNKSGPLIAGGITLIALAVVAFQGTRKDIGDSKWSYRYDTDENNNEDFEMGDESFGKGSMFSEPFNATTQRAELNIQGGATTYLLEDSTNNLFDANVKNNGANFGLEKTSRDSMEVLTFKMRGKNKNWKIDSKGNDVVMKMNSAPVWDINLEMGAGTAEFDLTPFKVQNLNLKGGAASFTVKLPEPQNTMDVNVETGVAEVNIRLPKSVGSRIKVDTGLSSRDFSGFTKQADGTYTTDNYNSAAKKINVNLKGGLSDFNVSRY